MVSYIVLSVSYTHLDVYKRQVHRHLCAALVGRGDLLGVGGVRFVAVRAALLRVELDIHRGMEGHRRASQQDFNGIRCENARTYRHQDNKIYTRILDQTVSEEMKGHPAGRNESNSSLLRRY